jgi:predicted naringenin-chalcone synthase
MSARRRNTAPSARGYLSGITPLDVGFVRSQAVGAAWLVAALRRVAQERPIPDLDRAVAAYERLGAGDWIVSRATALEDYTHQDWSRMTLFRDEHDAPAAHEWYRPPLEARMRVFADRALSLAQAAFADSDATPPTYMVQVSCTGYDSPNAIQRVASARGWGNATRLLHIGHMGCYAAVPATSLATALVPACPTGAGHAPARVSLFLVELCTLHVCPEATDVGTIVQQMLFADGAIRVDVTLEPGPGALAVLDTFEAIIPETAAEMTWRPQNSAFAMYLGRAVPSIIRRHIRDAVTCFLARNGVTPEDVAWWAIHPGGPKIIESVAESFELAPEAVTHSTTVLRTRGNMSSCTLPHVWHAMATDPAVSEGDLICSLAFGPGLTVAGNLLRKGA